MKRLLGMAWRAAIYYPFVAKKPLDVVYNPSYEPPPFKEYVAEGRGREPLRSV